MCLHRYRVFFFLLFPDFSSCKSWDWRCWRLSRLFSFLRGYVGGGVTAGARGVWGSAPPAGCAQGARPLQTSATTANPRGRQNQEGSHRHYILHFMRDVFYKSRVSWEGSFHLLLCWYSVAVPPRWKRLSWSLMVYPTFCSAFLFIFFSFKVSYSKVVN